MSLYFLQHIFSWQQRCPDRIRKNWPTESVIEDLRILIHRNIYRSATLKEVYGAATTFAGFKKLNNDEKSLTL
jgi:hypothetical protein